MLREENVGSEDWKGWGTDVAVALDGGEEAERGDELGREKLERDGGWRNNWKKKPTCTIN